MSPERSRKDTVIRVRVTPSQREELKGAADEEGLTLSSWLRSLALRTARRRISGDTHDEGRP